MDYILHLAILICIYSILAQSLSLVAGYGGQISLAHAGFYGLGAYVSALLAVDFGYNSLITLLLAMLLTGLIALIISMIAIKTVGDYYIVITLGIQVVIFSVMNNWEKVTGGPSGIPGIPPFNLFGYEFDSKISFILLSIFFVSLVWFVIYNITKSPFGRVLRALSEDEVYTKSLGKNVGHFKVVSFVISGMLASIAGVLYAHYISYIDPTSFSLDESIFILSIVIIGGMRNLKGIFLATIFLVLLPEALRFLGMPSSTAANMRQIIYGTALVLIIFQMNRKKDTPIITQSHSISE